MMKHAGRRLLLNVVAYSGELTDEVMRTRHPPNPIPVPFPFFAIIVVKQMRDIFPHVDPHVGICLYKVGVLSRGVCPPNGAQHLLRQPFI